MPKCNTDSGIVFSLLSTADSEQSKFLSQYRKRYAINTLHLIALKPGKDGVVGIMTAPRAHRPKNYLLVCRQRK